VSDEVGGLAGRNRVAVGVLAAVAVVLAACVYLALRPQPQMGTSDAVFHTVDALYTAVREQNPKLVDACEARLKAYRAEGKLPPDAADRLDAVIAKARSGSWQAAAERLYEFMQGQRREGAIEHDRPPAAKKAKPR
jgi:O-phosphoseryl-tRNA(Cys) synthetase